MRVVIQRSKESSVSVEGEVVGVIPHGLVLLVGLTHDDTQEDLEYCARKIANMRIFSDEDGHMNLSIQQTGGEILSISQFTLYGNTSKGNRPSFINAAKPEIAADMYHTFNDLLRDQGLTVATGKFGAMMDVNIINDGPVTILLDSKNR